MIEIHTNELSPVARYALADQLRCSIEVRQSMKIFLLQFEQLPGHHPTYVNLLPLTEVGPIVASRISQPSAMAPNKSGLSCSRDRPVSTSRLNHYLNKSVLPSTSRCQRAYSGLFGLCNGIMTTINSSTIPVSLTSPCQMPGCRGAFSGQLE